MGWVRDYFCAHEKAYGSRCRACGGPWSVATRDSWRIWDEERAKREMFGAGFDANGSPVEAA